MYNLNFFVKEKNVPLGGRCATEEGRKIYFFLFLIMSGVLGHNGWVSSTLRRSSHACSMLLHSAMFTYFYQLSRVSSNVPYSKAILITYSELPCFSIFFGTSSNCSAPRLHNPAGSPHTPNARKQSQYSMVSFVRHLLE